MTDIAPEGQEDNGTDDFDQEFEGAREAEHDDAAPPADDAPGDDDPAPPSKPDESEKRYRNVSKALKQARATARKEAEDLRREIAELRQQRAAPQQIAPTDQGPPDPTVDPIGAIQWSMEQERQRQAERDRQSQQTAAQQREQAEIRSYADWGREQEDDFRDENPDYDKAAKHLADTRLKELADLGYANPQQAFLNELLDITKAAKQSGKNPAEMVYKLAKNRGYGKAASVENLNRVARGQEQNRSLSSGGGRPASNGALTPGAVADLKGASFDQAFEKLRASQKRR